MLTNQLTQGSTYSRNFTISSNHSITEQKNNDLNEIVKSWRTLQNSLKINYAFGIENQRASLRYSNSNKRWW